MRKYYFLFLLILLAPAFAEVSECVNNSVSTCPSGVALRNLTIVTGVQGATIQFCSSDSDCVDTRYFKCFSDIDGVSSGTYTGWCNATGITSCYVNGTAYVTSYYYCTSSTAYQQCSSVSWGSSTSCSGNATCTSGTASPCGTTTTTTSSGGGSSPNTTTNTTTDTRKSSIAISSPISDFDLTQNEAATKSLTVKNNGNFTLDDVKLGISGIEPAWYSVSPSKFDNVTKGLEKTFVIAFSASSNATVKSYSVITAISTSNASATASATFTLRVLPSNATVEIAIVPLYKEFLNLIAELEKNITALKSKGVNTTEIRNKFNDIKAKLTQANASIEKKDYFAASQFLDSVRSLVTDVQASITQSKEPGFNIFLIVVVLIIIISIGILLYLLWPTGEGFHPQKGWQEPKKEASTINKILQKLKRKREEQKYEFKT